MCAAKGKDPATQIRIALCWRRRCRKSETRNVLETRRPTLPEKKQTLTTLREKLVKIGSKVVHHARYVIFQLAEVAVPRGGHMGNVG